MYQPEVYIPLRLKNLQARKLYKLSKIRRCTLVRLVNDIIKGYLEELSIDSSLPNTEIINSQLSDRKIIGERIAMLRQINCLTQDALGKAIGVDQRNISQIELGDRKLDIIKAKAIAQVLGVDLNEIVG